LQTWWIVLGVPPCSCYPLSLYTSCMNSKSNCLILLIANSLGQWIFYRDTNLQIFLSHHYLPWFNYYTYWIWPMCCSFFNGLDLILSFPLKRERVKLKLDHWKNGASPWSDPQDTMQSPPPDVALRNCLHSRVVEP
jgi:hypothetical protein